MPHPVFNSFFKSGKKRRSEKRRMSEHEMAAMRDQIEAERARLREEKDMAEEERNKAEAALRNHESELDKAQSDHDSMKQKLAALEKKIIVGGENLLDKVCAKLSSKKQCRQCGHCEPAILAR